MINMEKFPAESPLIEEQLKLDLQNIFQKLESPITIRAIADMESEKGEELALFLNTIVSLSPKLSLEVYAPSETEQVPELNAQYLPAAGLYKDGRYGGIAFHGVPGGKEINSLVLAIYNLSGPGQPIEKGLMKKIEKLKNPANIKIFVSLACHHCPKVVAACQQIASKSPLIEAEMIDANLYKDLVERYHIERVPVTVVNDRDIYIGPKTIEEMLYILKKIK